MNITVPRKALTIDKTTSTADYDEAGDTISYSYEVTNSGNVTLMAPFAVLDDLVDEANDMDMTDVPTSLAPGASFTVTANYEVDQADVDAGSVTNIAYATGKYGTTTITSPTDSVTVYGDQTAALTIDKTTSTADYDEAGDTISYSYEVTNSGNVTLMAPFAVLDDLVDEANDMDMSGVPAILAPGSSFTVTATYEVDQADMDDGSVTNIAYATGKFSGSTVASPTDSVTVYGDQTAALTIDKTTSTGDYEEAGDTISYSYEVTNSGNVTLMAPFAVLDDLIDAADIDMSGVPAILAPGASFTVTATYEVDQADIDAGSVTNVAYATGKFGESTVTSPTDTVTVEADQTAALTIDKTTSTADYDEAGDILSYSYEVTNSGNVTLMAPFAVLDDLIDAADIDMSGVPASLAPGASFTVTATYEVDQADVDVGSVMNIAYATGKYGTTTITSPTDSVTVYGDQTAALTIDKTTNTADYDEASDTISYSYEVTNSGNVTLMAPFAVLDDLIDAADIDMSGVPAILAPGASFTVTATYEVDQADIDAGSVTNVAYATGKFGESTVTSPTDTVTVEVDQTAALTIDKTTSTADYAEAGDILSYSYEVTNSGNVTLMAPFAVLDDLIDAADIDMSGVPASLAPGASFTVMATYEVDQADIDAKSVTNVAYATGKFGESTVTSPTDTVTVEADQTAALTIDKTTSTADYDEAGDTISYSYEVTNSGNVTLMAPFAVLDDLIDAADIDMSGVPATLAPGASFTVIATYEVDQADIDAGSVTNVAYATGKFGESTVTSPTDTVTVEADQTAALTIDKTTSTAGYDEAGDTISYSYEVTNSGNVTLMAPFAVLDDLIDAADIDMSGVPATLAPGASFTVIATYEVDQADIDAGSVTNVAYATGKFGESTVTSPTDTVTVEPDQTAALTIDKTTSTAGYDEAGDILSYSYEVTNSGNVTLMAPFAVLDDLIDAADIDMSGVPASLAPGASFTVTATYEVDQADVDAGSVTNIAYATGKYGTTTIISPTDSVTVYGDLTPAIELTKTGTLADTNGDGVDSAGDTISYTFSVKNTGNVTLTDITLADTVGGVTIVGGPIASLAPGATNSAAFTGSYVATQADIDAGTFTNVATVTGHYFVPETEPQANLFARFLQLFVEEPSGIVTDDDDDTQTFEQVPSLVLIKTGTFAAGTNNLADPGEIITYSFTVTNTGNITLTGATVTDPLAGLSAITLSGTTIPVGGSITGTAVYAVTQANINQGFVYNLATADSIESGSDTDDETVTLAQNPAITIDKSSKKMGTVDPFGDFTALMVGETALYQIVVKNTGNTSLLNVILSDDQVAAGTVVTVSGGGTLTFSLGTSGLQEINLGTMAVGQQISLTYTYTTVSTDVIRLVITNVAAVSTQIAPTTAVPAGRTLRAADSSIVTVEDIPLVQPSITIDKKVQNLTLGGSPSDLATGVPGNIFQYTVVVTNTGNMHLSRVKLSDNKAVAGGTVKNVTDNTTWTWLADGTNPVYVMLDDLASGESVTLTYTYTGTEADAAAIRVNTAMVDATVTVTLNDQVPVTLHDDDVASVSVEKIPTTGETDSSTVWGIVILLGVLAAMIFRRRRTNK